MSRSDPHLPPGTYADLARANDYRLSYADAHRALMGSSRRPDLDEVAEDLVKKLEETKRQPREQKKGFWSRVNDAVGSVFGESSLTDQITGVIDIVPHVYRAYRQQKFEQEQETGKTSPDSILGVFSPSIWAGISRAWRETQHGESYFLGLPATDLPKLADDIAKRYISGQKEQDIADQLGIGRDPEEGKQMVQAILSSPKVQHRMEQYQKSKVSLGRDVAQFWLNLEHGSTPYNVVSGAIDFATAFLDPTIAAGKAAEVAKGARSLESAVKSAEKLDEVLEAPKWTQWFHDVANEKSATKILRQHKALGSKNPNTGKILAQALAETDTAEEAEHVFRSFLGHDKTLQQLTKFAPPRKNVVFRGPTKLHNWLEVGDDTRWKRIVSGAMRGFRDLPREFDPEDILESHSQIGALIDMFPKAFAPAERTKILDKVMATSDPSDMFKIVEGVLNKGAKVMKVDKYRAKGLTKLWHDYIDLRRWGLTEGGDPMKHVVGEAMRMAHTRLSSETVSHIPMFSARDLRNIRWAQSSRTKYFVTHEHLANILLAPSRITGGVWKTMILATRPAWTLRVLGEEALRIMARGKSVGPRTAWKAMNFEGDFAKFADMPARVSFWKHPFQWATTMPENMATGVMTGRSRQLFEGAQGGYKVTRTWTGDTTSVEGWRFMLEKLLESPEVVAHLKGHSLQEIHDMLRGDWKDSVLKRLKNLGSIESERDIDNYLGAMIDRVTATLHGNAELEDVLMKVARGEMSPRVLKGNVGRDLLLRQPNPPSFVTTDFTARQGNLSLFGRLQEGAFKYLMDVPTTRLNRLRLYSTSSQEAYTSAKSFAQRTGTYIEDADALTRYTKEWRADMEELIMSTWDETTELGKSIGPEGLAAERAYLQRKLEKGPSMGDIAKYVDRDGLVTENMILDSAKTFGVNEVLATLYDPRKKTRLEQQLATEFPFLAAYKEFLVTWARIMGERPSNIGKAAQLIQSQQQASFEDSMVFRNDEGKKIDLGPLNWFVKKMTGTGTTFTSPLESFNMFTQSPFPGTGPMVQYAAMLLAEAKPDWEDLTTFVTGGYGLRTIREEGLAGYGIAAIDGFLPSGLREMRLALETAKSSPEYANRVAQEFRQLAIKRFKNEDAIPWDNREVMMQLYRDAEKAVKATSIIIGLAKQVFPGTIQREYPYQDFVNQARAMMASEGEDAAYDWLREQLGPGASFLLEPLSKSDMPPTREAYKLYQENKELAKEYSSLFWDLFQNKASGELAFDVYRWQFGEKGQGEGYSINPDAIRNTTEWMNSAELSEAWRKYTDARDHGEELMRQGLVSREQHLWTMRQVKAQLAMEFPYWGKHMGNIENKAANWENFYKDIKALGDKVKDTPEGQGLLMFAGAVEAAQDELEALGLQRTSFEADSAIGVRDRLNRAAQEIARLNPDFEPFYWSQIVWRLDPDAIEQGRGRMDVLSLRSRAA